MPSLKASAAPRAASEMLHYSLQATDGALGRVKDLYFDDLEWQVRYMVADTGRWLFGHRVLISPVCAGRPDAFRHVVPVCMSRDMVERAPGCPAGKQFSRAEEAALAEFYGWPHYWQSEARVSRPPWPVGGEGAPPERGGSGSHLRSARVVAGYRIVAQDEEIGQVDDFLLEPDAWVLRYLVLASGSGGSGDRTVIPTGAVGLVDCDLRRVELAVTLRTARTSPPVRPSLPLSRKSEAELCDHFGCPRYWGVSRQPSEEG